MGSARQAFGAIHHAIHDRPHVPPLAAAPFSGRDQRLDIPPFARISQVIAVVLRPVLVRASPPTASVVGPRGRLVYN
jgi:hypothetical protein